MQMKRDDYKAIKHMDKKQLTEYLSRVYRRGYEAGLKAGMAQAAKVATPTPEDTSAE